MFGFGLLPYLITLKKITELLGQEHKDVQSLLKPAVEGTDWLYCLTKLRNIGAHRSSFNVRIARSPEGYGDDSISQLPSLRYTSDIDVISYLDESLHKLKQLIDCIIDMEPDLKYQDKA